MVWAHDSLSLPDADGGVAAVIELVYRTGQVESRVVEGVCERYTVRVVA